jgi:hypothetical protein
MQLEAKQLSLFTSFLQGLLRSLGGVGLPRSALSGVQERLQPLSLSGVGITLRHALIQLSLQSVKGPSAVFAQAQGWIPALTLRTQNLHLAASAGVQILENGQLIMQPPKFLFGAHRRHRSALLDQQLQLIPESLAIFMGATQLNLQLLDLLFMQLTQLSIARLKDSQSRTKGVKIHVRNSFRRKHHFRSVYSTKRHCRIVGGRASHFTAPQRHPCEQATVQATP